MGRRILSSASTEARAKACGMPNMQGVIVEFRVVIVGFLVVNCGIRGSKTVIVGFLVVKGQVKYMYGEKDTLISIDGSSCQCLRAQNGRGDCGIPGGNCWISGSKLWDSW